MPLISESTTSAMKSRFGFHQRQPSDQLESSMALNKSSSSPDLSLKSAARDNFVLQSSYKDRSSNSDDGETVEYVGARSFEFREDPSFWKEHNVQVIIRIRPLSTSELSVQGNNRCVKQDSSQSITWIGHPESRFTFDIVADESVSQEMLFKVAGVPMVENCMEGYNSCMFAYGQTGSGKTHTMLGDIENGARRHSVNCGMTPRVFDYLFSRIQKDKDARREEKLKFTCKCSFLEIYNEQIFDLLDPSSTNLQIREDIKRGVHVENLTEVEVTSSRDVLQQLIQGASNRKVAATNMNRASSRSHSVFTCIIESKWESQGVTHHRFARLNLVDLAGSERQKSSGAEGERLKEATNINKSLSTLGLVIMNLVSVSNGKSHHVPYRDSKLTFLLQDSLGGNAKTIIIANISPSSCCSLETLSTLKFAQRAKFIKNHAIVNEDASGDVLALRLENQNLKKEVSRLRSLVNGGVESQEDGDVLPLGFPSSPGSFKWDGLRGLSSPLISEKKMSHFQKKEYDAALVGAFRREKDKDTALQALAAENQAALQLAKQREDEIQGLKMRLRFREAGIKRLEAVASGKISAEVHLLKEKEEYLKEIEVLRAQVDRNQEATRFAMENLRLKEEIRRLKSFCEEGERESMAEQIAILENKLLEALDWKLMHESNPANVQKESSSTVMDIQNDNFFSFNQESASPWRTSTNEENEFLRMQAIQNQSELDSLRKRLDFCIEEKEKLERHVTDLAKELEAERLSKEVMAEKVQNPQTEFPSLLTDQTEIKTMVDAIAAASQREAQAHEMTILLSKENDELRMKLKVLIEDNNKLIDLYERAVADNTKNSSGDSLNPQENANDEHVPNLTEVVEEKDQEMKRELESLNHQLAEMHEEVEEKDQGMKRELESLNHQLAEMHEENDKLLSLYETAMQERDELKRVIASGNKGDLICPEKLVEIDEGQSERIDETGSPGPYVQNDKNDLDLESNQETLTKSIFKETSLHEVHVEIVDMEIDELKKGEEQIEINKLTENTTPAANVSKDLNTLRRKLVEAQEKLSYSTNAVSMFHSLEKAIIEVDSISEEICKLENGIRSKQQECAYLKSVSSELKVRKDLSSNKLSALKHPLKNFSSSISYYEQHEAQARSWLKASSENLIQKKNELDLVRQSRKEVMDALLKVKQTETELRNGLENLRSKYEEENKKLESDRVLFAIDNVEKTPHLPISSKATELLKSEEEKTKLQNQIKLQKEKLGDVRKEAEVMNAKLSEIDSEIQVREMDVQKVVASTQEMEQNLQIIVQKKEMVIEMKENGRNDFENMIIEYHQSVFDCELKEEEIKIMDKEVVNGLQKIHDLQRAKNEAVRRKQEMIEAFSCNENFVAERMEADLHDIQRSIAELNSLIENYS